MKNVLLFTALAFCCTGCMLKSDKSFMGSWSIKKLESRNTDGFSQRIYQDAYLSFYDDGRLSFYQKFADEPETPPRYFVGTWKEYGAGLELWIDSLRLHQKFEISSPEQLILTVTGNPLLTGTTFTCVPLEHYKNADYDLLRPDNNAWRQKPGQKETPAEVKTRVIHHLQYLSGYFQIVEDKEQEHFETVLLQTPVRFHRNGLSLLRKFEKTNTWRSCFFNEADATAGGKLLKQSVMSIKKYPSDEESPTRAYHAALKMMITYLEGQPDL